MWIEGCSELALCVEMGGYGRDAGKRRRRRELEGEGIKWCGVVESARKERTVEIWLCGRGGRGEVLFAVGAVVVQKRSHAEALTEFRKA